MIVRYDGYSYIDDTSKDKNVYQYDNKNNVKYQYSSEHFQQLINQQRYEDAADYISQYKLDDPAQQRELEANIINLRRQGRIASAIWSKVNKDDADKFRFANSVFSNGGLELSDDSYTKKFTDIKNRIGSTDEEQASKLQITFEPEKQTMFGIDWLAPDNAYTIDNFYKTSGLSSQDLLEAGVEITHKDGKTTLTFDKSNGLANKILYYMPDNDDRVITPKGDKNLISNLVGLFRDTKSQKEWEGTINDNAGFLYSTLLPTISGLNDKGEVISSGKGKLHQFRQYIDDALDVNDKYTMGNGEEKQYTSLLGGWIDDDMARLHEAYERGEIDEKQLNKALKNSNSRFVYDALASLGSSRYEIYSNGFNENANDETLHLMENKQRAEIVRQLSSYASSPKDLIVMAGEVNGQLGCWVTIGAEKTPTKELDESSTSGDATINRRTQIFIPGLLTEEAQAKLDANTEHRAIRETNLMQEYGYTYPVRDGSKISYKNGSFYKDKEQISKEDAIREINGAIILENSISTMKYNYLNKDDGFLDREGYEEEAQLRAIAAMNELYPNTPLVDTDGYQYTIDDIFNHKTASGKPLNRSTVQFDVWRKMEEIYKMYNDLMKGISYYD